MKAEAAEYQALLMFTLSGGSGLAAVLVAPSRLPASRGIGSGWIDRNNNVLVRRPDAPKPQVTQTRDRRLTFYSHASPTALARAWPRNLGRHADRCGKRGYEHN